MAGSAIAVLLSILSSVPARASTVGGAELAGHGVLVNYAPGVRHLPDIAASAWVIADADTGQVLAAKDPHGQYRPASTLKVLTAVSLIPALNPDDTTVATQLAASQEPNDIGLQPGQSYRISDLFTALLTLSANDAGVALAQATGSLDHGMALINAAARRLQADDTFAVTPNGLDGPGQRISAYDLALIARHALSMPAFMHYDTVMGGPFRINAHKSVGLFNQNGLLTQYRGGIGGKIGWTSLAGATYVGMARRDGRTLVVSLLHCPALTEVASAEKLLDWGFATDGKVAPVGLLVPPLAAAPRGSAPPAARSVSVHAQRAPAAPHASSATAASVLIAVSFTTIAAVAIVRTRRQRFRRPS
jgi:D-alanyl-D-alanine carboxypeptidase (penicillin-binding protein 5/6)